MNEEGAKKGPELPHFSPATWGLERLFRAAQFLSPANHLFGTRVESQSRFSYADTSTYPAAARRSRRIDFYIFAWCIIEIAVILIIPAASRSFQALLLVVLSIRVFEVFQAAMNMNIFDRLRLDRQEHYVAGFARTAIFSVWNFFEVALCFGAAYSTSWFPLSQKRDLLDPFYFSVVTQLTIGYGDISPVGITRLATMCQSLLGFLLGIFAISRIVAFLPRMQPVFEDE